MSTVPSGTPCKILCSRYASLPKVSCVEVSRAVRFRSHEHRIKRQGVYHARFSPLGTIIRRPIPGALRSSSTPGSVPHGHCMEFCQTGSTAPLLAHSQFLSSLLPFVADEEEGSFPHAAQMSHSCVTSRMRTLERRTYRLRTFSSDCDSDGEPSYSTRYVGTVWDAGVYRKTSWITRPYEQQKRMG